MEVFTQIVILMIVLACMVMVLLAIRQLGKSQGFDNIGETEHLREDLEEDGHPMSSANIFSNLVDLENYEGSRDKEKEMERQPYKSNSNDPLSRRE